MANDEILEKLEEIRTVTLLDKKDAYTVQDAQFLTGLSKKHIYRLVQERAIPHYRSEGGKLIYFHKEDLNNWMMHSRVESKENIEREAIKRTLLS